MATARDLIKGSLRLLGVYASGETPASADLADGLLSLNAMLGSWSNERLVVPARTRESFSVSVSPVTIGVGATLNTSRPLRIDAAAILSGTIELPLEILNAQRWQAISNKDMTSAIPTHLYADGTYPNETINLWPEPAGSVTLIIYSLKPLTAFANADATLTLPDGYGEAIRYNLALRLAPEYGKPVSAEVVALARESKAAIKRMNIKPMTVVSDAFGVAGCNSSYDFLKGE